MLCHGVGHPSLMEYCSREGLPQKTSLRPHGLVQTGNLTLDSVQGFCVEVKT